MEIPKGRPFATALGDIILAQHDIYIAQDGNDVDGHFSTAPLKVLIPNQSSPPPYNEDTFP